MSINGKFKDFTQQDFLIVADRFGVGEALSVIAAVKDAIKRWPSFAKKAGIKLSVAESVKRQLLIKPNQIWK